MTFQQLTNKFRLDYARFWTTILQSDVEGLKHYSEVLGIGPLHGLFACMVTGRSWDSISTGGIAKESTANEVTNSLACWSTLELEVQSSFPFDIDRSNDRSLIKWQNS